MGIYTIFYMFKNPRTCRQARNLTTKISKILDLKSSSEQIFSENCRWVPLLIRCYFTKNFFFSKLPTCYLGHSLMVLWLEMNAA